MQQNRHPTFSRIAAAARLTVFERVEIFPGDAAFADGAGHELMSTLFITEASIVSVMRRARRAGVQWRVTQVSRLLDLLPPSPAC